MLEGLINSIVESASPAITKWRSFFLVVSLVLTSDDIGVLYSVDLMSVSLDKIISSTASIISNSKLVMFSIFSILFFIIAPYANYFFIHFNVKRTLLHADSLLNSLEVVRKKSKDEMDVLIADTFDSKKREAQKSELFISKLKIECELLVCGVFLYLATSIYLHVFNLMFFILVLVVAIVFTWMASRKILVIYLKDIAPYRILEDYIKYFVVVR